MTFETPTALPVLYQDEYLLAVAKPSGMFVHRTDKDRTDQNVVLQIVRDQIDAFIYPVHRLDRATSGIVLLALSSDAAAALSAAFAERRVRKTYQALVRGFCADEGQIVRPLVPPRDRKRPKSESPAVPQEAETHFRTLQRFEVPIPNGQHQTSRSSLVEVNPRTGRFHQIRRHLNSESHPVIGDTSHGDSRHNAIYRKHFGLQRLMLAAVRLEFEHPYTNDQIVIECSPEPSFAEVVEQLQRYLADLKSNLSGG